MKTKSRSAACSTESLEARIAPAGLVSAALSAAGHLTLSTVDSGVAVQLELLTGGEWVLTAVGAGDTVQFNDGPVQTEFFSRGSRAISTRSLRAVRISSLSTMRRCRRAR